MNDTKIKKCPFCGGDPVVNVKHNDSNGFYYTNIRCLCCYSQSSAVRSYTQPEPDDPHDRAVRLAAERWNRRQEGEE